MLAALIPYVLSALTASALVLSLYALLRAEKPRLIAAEKRVRDLEIEVAGMSDSFDSLRTSVKRINSRYAMRDKRAQAKAETDDGLPDPTTDPEAWRAAMQTKYPRGVFSINGAGNGR